jgi:hypothetical protein
MSYFKENGVEYLAGGVESGFVKVRTPACRTAPCGWRLTPA